MNFDLSEEQLMLQDQVGRLFQERCPSSLLRSVIEQESGWDPALWQRLAELGVLGAAIPEQYGGVGLTELDLCVVLEEAGKAVAPLPLYSSICLGAETIRIAGNAEQKARWLPALASGEQIAAMVYPGGTGLLGTGKGRVSVNGDRISGAGHPAADAQLAHVLVIPVHGDTGCTLYLVESDQPGVALELLPGFDQLRRHYRVCLDDAAAVPLGHSLSPQELCSLECRAAVYCAFEQLGGAEACLRMASEYAAQRQIFGRSLASYQGIKHKLADIYVLVELARCNACYAAWAIASGAEDQLAAAAVARISASQAFEQASRENLQVHGGIGYTWEADCHFYYRRSRLLALNCGSVEIWNDRLVAALATTDAA